MERIFYKMGNICLNNLKVSKEDFKKIEIWFKNRFTKDNFNDFIKKINLQIKE